MLLKKKWLLISKSIYVVESAPLTSINEHVRRGDVLENENQRTALAVLRVLSPCRLSGECPLGDNLCLLGHPSELCEGDWV